MHHSKRPHHSITSSTWASSVGGSVRPSIFAVFRLMISSNVVGCSMGNSEGLAPFKIRSTKTPRRDKTATRAAYTIKPPDAAGRQPHVDAGDGVRNREGVLCYLTRPAAILNAPWRVVE